jgi:drug/metabolite transporter (DMT)-like permease
MTVFAVSTGPRVGWGVACVVLATLGWSLSGVFVRALPGLEAWTMNAYRAGCTSILLLVYLAIRYRADVGRHLWPAERHGLVIVGIVFAGGSTLYLLALTMASVASVACIGATAPLFAAVLAWLVMREKTSIIVLVAAMVAIAGVFLIMGAERAAFATGLGGKLVALLVAWCFAGQTVAMRRYRNIEVIPGVVLGGALVVVVAAVINAFPRWPEPDRVPGADGRCSSQFR